MTQKAYRPVNRLNLIRQQPGALVMGARAGGGFGEPVDQTSAVARRLGAELKCLRFDHRRSQIGRATASNGRAIR
jgi:hypothetical protein